MNHAEKEKRRKEAAMLVDDLFTTTINPEWNTARCVDDPPPAILPEWVEDAGHELLARDEPVAAMICFRLSRGYRLDVSSWYDADPDWRRPLDPSSPSLLSETNRRTPGESADRQSFIDHLAGNSRVYRAHRLWRSGSVADIARGLLRHLGEKSPTTLEMLMDHLGCAVAEAHDEWEGARLMALADVLKHAPRRITDITLSDEEIRAMTDAAVAEQLVQESRGPLAGCDDLDPRGSDDQ
jgi:hypothetical protein